MPLDSSNKTVIHTYVAALNAGDFKSLKSCFAPDAVIHGVLGHGSVDFAMSIWRDLHACLSMKLEIEDIVEDGSSVVVRYRETGNSRIPFRNLPATGKTYELPAIEWFIVSNGLITQRWGVRDSGSQARQLGWQS